MKKVFSLLVVLSLMLGLGIVTFAADDINETSQHLCSSSCVAEHDIYSFEYEPIAPMDGSFGCWSCGRRDNVVVLEITGAGHTFFCRHAWCGMVNEIQRNVPHGWVTISGRTQCALCGIGGWRAEESFLVDVE